MNFIDLQDLSSKYTVQEVPPLVCYIPNFITKEEESDITQKVNSAPLPKWTQLSHRRLQNWGGIPHPKGMIAEEIPKWLEVQIDKIAKLNIFDKDKRPNHVLINEYLPGQGIMAHSDGPLFHPIVTTISCGSHTLLEFYKRHETDKVESPKREFSLLLEPRSLLILQKDLYHDYLHSIDERSTDLITKCDIKNLNMCSHNYNEGEILERSTRLSLTIRHVPKTSKLKLKFGK
ncbi:alpha-ketoglutarate-dependent dioxygenase alkB homolog 6 [Nasonia vitripennis]|uniref:Fe2OG dioxygenase domain-containing protein n=1 Tax=Nasonia vitripennis TaxID=7425 RepID=A0A7M7HFQ2_NASVI|nr:alpha-ketoglutarate-dependent dioxygenase alkB homolog 6 [Nasonia vitripennis]XP_008213509.1 alpha-ketoglutarate-dependent dioxygenase alkB homolog 6 [Nasonia vitripennis]XP_032454489.1 alpha-ketoglutarate-dependent dioxygenase alkB homolog 6 [Nasonia vitripennis]